MRASTTCLPAKRLSHRARAATFGLLAALPLLAAAPALADTVLHRGIVDTPETLDPQLAATVSETAILLDLFEGLVTNDAGGRPIPGAATSWTVSPDGLVYTFTLRDGARWSNGDPVKAADFVASFRRLFDPATGATEDGLLQVIQGAGAIKRGIAKPDTLGVKALDPATLEITLERPTPTFLARLALPVALPVYVSAIKRLGADFAATGKIISNGPYRLGAIDRNDGYILQRNPRYAATDAVAIDSIVYRPFETAGACVDAFRADEVQSCSDVATDKLPDLRKEFGAELHVAPFGGTYFYVFNLSKKPFDDVRVREALGLAIDRDALATEAWSGGMVAAPALVPQGLSGTPAPETRPGGERRARARALLRDAGFDPAKADGKKLAIEIRVGTGAAHEETAKLVADQWKAIGVDTTIRTEPNSAHFIRLRDGGDFDVARTGWIVDEADPIDLLTLFRSDNVRFNYPRYRNADFDKLLDQAAVETDPAKRASELGTAEAMLDRDQPLIPLLGYASLSLVSPKLSGWQDNILNQHPSRFLSLSE